MAGLTMISRRRQDCGPHALTGLLLTLVLAVAASAPLLGAAVTPRGRYGLVLIAGCRLCYCPRSAPAPSAAPKAKSKPETVRRLKRYIASR
jgi:hypothetical protein